MRLVSFYALLCTSRARQRWSILEYIHLNLLVFFTKNLHTWQTFSTHKKALQKRRLYHKKNSTWIQEKSRRKSTPTKRRGWFTRAIGRYVYVFFVYMCVKLFICRSFSLSFSLCLCEMEFQSGAALYSLWNGIQIISTMLFTLYFMRRIIRAHFNWHQRALPFSLSFVR